MALSAGSPPRDGTPQAPDATNWLLISLLGVIWGAAFLSVRVALDGYGPWTVVAGRTGIGALVLCLVGAAMGQGPAQLSQSGPRAWPFAIVIGLLGLAIPQTLLAFGQQYVPSAFAGIAMGMIPLLVLPLAWAFTPEEGIGPRRVAGMVLGFVGLVLLVGNGALADSGPYATFGRFACLAAAACYATGSIITRRAPPVAPIALASATLLAAAVPLVPLALWFEGLPQIAGPRPTLGLLYAALLPTALAAVIRVRVIKSAGSVFMSLTSYMVPVWAVIFGILLLGEDLPPQLFAALGLILAGIAISQSRALAGLWRR